MVEFLADVAGNHNGDRERCRRLISEALRIGCAAIQFPLFRVEQLFAPQVLKVSAPHRQWRQEELPRRFVPELSDWARENGLKFGLMVFDLDTVDACQEHVDFLAVSPYELPWLDLVDRCADTGLPLILDTGMAEAGETWNAIQTALEAGCTDLTMLRSIARYPAPDQVCNLSALGTLRELLVREFAPVYTDAELKAGWSDNSVSPGVIARAVNHWGCDTVSFRLDLEGEGDSFQRGHCWLPDRIAEVIAGGFLPVRKDSDGNGRLAPDPSELEERRWRADPGDGLRPVAVQRTPWANAQPEATRRGPDVYFVVTGPGRDAGKRCLALAENLRDNHDADVLFLIDDGHRQARHIERCGFNWAGFEDLHNVVAQVAFLNNITADNGPPVCVIDTPDDTAQVIADLRAEGVLTVVVAGHPEPAADLTLVPSFGWRDGEQVSGVAGGTGFILLPGEIMTLRQHRRTVAAGSRFPRVVVSFDACQPHDLTTPMLTALHEVLPDGAVQAVLDPSADRCDVAAQILASRFPAFEIIATEDSLEPILATADLVITRPDLTALAALSLAVPVLIMADDPGASAMTADLVASGAAVDLGTHPELTDEQLASHLRSVLTDPDRLSRLRFHARELAAGPLDGHGAARAADRIMQLMPDDRP